MNAALVFNLHEVGISEWEDCKEKKVIFSKAMDSQTIHYVALRNAKHISIIACISALGESLTAYVVISQDSEVLRRRLVSHDLRLGVDFGMRQGSKSSVSGKLSREYINSIFIPCLNELRESEKFTGCEAALLIDNRLLHMSDAVIAVLPRERVRVITFTPHTTLFTSSKCLMWCYLAP
jgi:hypothetical protein